MSIGDICSKKKKNTYVIATGSDEIISRTFSQPSVVMYAIE